MAPQTLRLAAGGGAPIVLVLVAGRLSRVLAAVPALRALRAAFPRHELVVAGPPWSEDLLLGSGLADLLVPPSGPPAACLRRWPDLAVDLGDRGAGDVDLLLAAHPRRLLAFADPRVPETAGAPLPEPGVPPLSAWCALLAAHGVPSDPDRIEVQPSGPVPPAAAGATLLHPGGGRLRWPLGRFAAVGRLSGGPRRAIAVAASPGELDLAAEVACRADLTPGDVLPACTSTAALAGAIAIARCVLTGDPGVARLAMALGTPSVLVAEPASLDEWAPAPLGRRHVALSPGPRDLRRAPDGAREPSGGQGFLDIPVERVLAALETVVEAGGAGAPERSRRGWHARAGR